MTWKIQRRRPNSNYCILSLPQLLHGPSMTMSRMNFARSEWTAMPQSTTIPICLVSHKQYPSCRHSTDTSKGLLIIPSLVPPAVQKVLLSRLIHRDLSDAKHTTNMHQ